MNRDKTTAFNTDRPTLTTLTEKLSPLAASTSQRKSRFLLLGVHGGQRVECGAIDRIKKAADLPKHFRPFHGLRHHYAVLLASSGEFNLDQIGQLLTHKSSDITRRYAHFLPEAQQRAADRAAEIITAHTATAGNKEENKVVAIRNRK